MNEKKIANTIRQDVFKKNIPDFAKLKGIEIESSIPSFLQPTQAKILHCIYRSRQALPPATACFDSEASVQTGKCTNSPHLTELPQDEQADYIIAMHSAGNVPDFIAFFQDAASRLKEQGKLFLSFPEYFSKENISCFETTAGHLIVDHESPEGIDSAEHILDQMICNTGIADITWSEILQKRFDLENHIHAFTFEHFAERILRPLIKMRYLPFSVIDYCKDDLFPEEFYVTLEKCTDENNFHICGQKITLQPLPEKPETDIFNIRYQMQLIKNSGYFDQEWYLNNYEDVRKSDLSPLEHYYYRGAFQGYSPSPYFDSKYYLTANPDVAAANYNPLWHYLQNGKQEGRHPLPDKKAQCIVKKKK